MFWTELVIALVIGLTLTLVLVFGFRRSRGINGFAGHFLVLFLASWAGGLWARPYGSVLLGVYWFPFLVTGLIVSLLIIALVPRDIPHTESEALEQIQEKRTLFTFGSAIFWVLLGVLSGVIIVGYTYPR